MRGTLLSSVMGILRTQQQERTEVDVVIMDVFVLTAVEAMVLLEDDVVEMV